jgi:hypothetical protein
LEELDLTDNRLSRLPALGSMPRLTTLSLFHNFHLSLDSGDVDAICSQLPALRGLRLGTTSSIAAVIQLAQRMPNLTIA